MMKKDEDGVTKRRYKGRMHKANLRGEICKQILSILRNSVSTSAARDVHVEL